MTTKAEVSILLAVMLFGVCPIEADQVMLSEITTSCILDTNVTYYVPDPPLLIHSIDGNEIDIIIPSDILIISAQTSSNYPAIFVYDSANIQTGSPAPEPNVQNEILATGDTNNPVEPVWIVGESGNPFTNNQYGIVIDRSAGKRCWLNNIYLSGFNYGIVVDQQLEYPLSNIYVYGCYNGILSFGQNKIVNSYVSYFGDEGSAYCYVPQSWDGSITFEGANFEICNCLADDGGYGFEAYGLPAGLAPNFRSRDCAATNCYSAFNGWSGYLMFSIICPGLYNNVYNKNFPEMPFTDPVYETNNPLVIDNNDYRIFLDPNSQFVNRGSCPSQFPGWTTRIDGTPDVNIGDIWLHYQTKKHEPSADLNIDYVVDVNDLLIFATQWLQDTYIIKADLNNDNIVNFLDYVIFANQWQSHQMSIKIFNLETYNRVDSNNIQGDVGICLENVPLYDQTVSVYVDNLLIGSLLFGWDIEEDWIGLESDKFLNGWHTIRLVSTDYSGNVINHKPAKVRFNNLLYKVSAQEHFSSNNDYRLGGFYDGNSTLEAKVKDMYGSQIWSNTYSGPYVNIVVPAAAFGSEKICDITVSETGSGGMMATPVKSGTLAATDESPPVTVKSLTRKFDPNGCAGVRMVIVMPDKDVFKPKKPAILACAQACQNRGVSWVPLYYHDVTLENLTNLFTRSSVKYIYWCGHANSHVGKNERLNIEGVQRTNTQCWKLVDEDIIWDDYERIGVFSWTLQTRSGYPTLPNNWDYRGFDLWSLNMSESVNKKIVFVDGCLSGKYDDMACAYGMFSLAGWGWLDQIYIGWDIEVTMSSERIGEFFVGDSIAGITMFWQRMGTGSSPTNNVWAAFYYTQQYGSSQMRKTLWGDNALFDGGTGDDHIRIYGNGGVNLSNIRLQP